MKDVSFPPPIENCQPHETVVINLFESSEKCKVVFYPTKCDIILCIHGAQGIPLSSENILHCVVQI